MTTEDNKAYTIKSIPKHFRIKEIYIWLQQQQNMGHSLWKSYESV